MKSGRYLSKYGDRYDVRYVPSVDLFYLKKVDSKVGTFISESDLQRQVDSGWLTFIL